MYTVNFRVFLRVCIDKRLDIKGSVRMYKYRRRHQPHLRTFFIGPNRLVFDVFDVCDAAT